MEEREAKKFVVDAGRRLVKEGLIARTWGNVSCRIDGGRFAITPSGRDYMELTAEDIVTVQIMDCSYEGEIKPSSEKGIHADVYKLKPNAGFVIHTHQPQASVISALGIPFMDLQEKDPLLGTRVICAEYGLPGTKKLRKNVQKAWKESDGKAVIMMNHGTVCVGADLEEAFDCATRLEAECEAYVLRQYISQRGQRPAGEDMVTSRQASIAGLEKIMQRPLPENKKSVIYYHSERRKDGFVLYNGEAEKHYIRFTDNLEFLPKEARIHKQIYLKQNRIQMILHSSSRDVRLLSHAAVKLPPLVDDFAQIVGTRVRTYSAGDRSLPDGLCHASAVMIHKHGALCCGATRMDAEAVEMILEKNARAFLYCNLTGKMRTISHFDSWLMHAVYKIKYAKQLDQKKKR